MRRAGGPTQRVARAIRAAIGPVVLAAALALANAPVATAAEPTPGIQTPAASPDAGGDPRVPGDAPGLVGEPLLAVGVVAIVAGLSVGAALAYVRLTARPPTSD